MSNNPSNADLYTAGFSAAAISSYVDYTYAKQTAKNTVASAEKYVKANNKWGIWDKLWALRRAGFSGKEIRNSFPTDSIEDSTVVELFSIIVHWNDERDNYRLKLKFFLSEIPAKFRKDVMQTAVHLVSLSS